MVFFCLGDFLVGLCFVGGFLVLVCFGFFFNILFNYSIFPQHTPEIEHHKLFQILNTYKQEFLLLSYFDNGPLKSLHIMAPIMFKHIYVLSILLFILLYCGSSRGKVRMEGTEMDQKKYSIFLSY